MTSPLHQLQLAYDQTQDRMLLTLTAKDFSEYRFWVTRRAVKVLWQVAQHLIKGDQKTDLEHNQESQAMADKIQEEKSQRSPTADKMSHRLSRRPLGDEPLLLYKVGGNVAENGDCALRLEDNKGIWIQFNGNSKIITALCQLILETLKAADWNLQLESN